MKKILLLFLFFLSQFCFAQNLVPNPSFEDTVACPNSIDEVYNCLSWSSFGNTSDYYNSCNTVNIASVPNNFYGYQFAHSGNAYCGLANYIPPPNTTYREYIGSQLTDSMQIGTQYFISFYTNLSNTRRCNSNKIGIKFSTIPYSSSQPPPQNNWAHLFSQSLISDTVNWTFITGSFIADSNYKYIIVGNFFDNANTDTLDCGPASGSGTYLYIDDVCVSTDSLTCNPDIKVGNIEYNNNFSIQIYPNPSRDYLIIESSIPVNINEIKIYNLYYELLEFNCEKLSNNKYILKFNNPSNGIYFLSIVYDDKKYLTKKIIINN